MSAWPEAVWIVKHIQDNFDFEYAITDYTDKLNSINSTVNSLSDRVQILNDTVVTKALTAEELNSEEGLPNKICLIVEWSQEEDEG